MTSQLKVDAKHCLTLKVNFSIWTEAIQIIHQANDIFILKYIDRYRNQ
jgi:hypothetical protein